MKLMTEMQDGCVHALGYCVDTENVKPLEVAKLEHDAAAAHALMQAIDAEPEYPGDMPDEMWEMVRGDRHALTVAFRLAVKQTKSEIAATADAILRSWGFEPEAGK